MDTEKLADDEFINNGTYIALFLNRKLDRKTYLFNSTDDLEMFLKDIKLKDYCYKNILFYLDGEMNIEVSKLYKKRYL
jgi:hypothetical protein